MRKVAALALMLIQMSVFCGQEMLRLLSEEEYESAKTEIQWCVDNLSEYFSKSYMARFEENSEKLLKVKGLPSYVRTISFKEKSEDEVDQISLKISNDIMFKMGRITQSISCFVDAVSSPTLPQKWHIYIFDGHPKKGWREFVGFHMAFKCYYIDNATLKIAAWSLDDTDERECKELAEEIADMIAFVLE